MSIETKFAIDSIEEIPGKKKGNFAANIRAKNYHGSIKAYVLLGDLRDLDWAQNQFGQLLRLIYDDIPDWTPSKRLNKSKPPR